MVWGCFEGGFLGWCWEKLKNIEGVLLDGIRGKQSEGETGEGCHVLVMSPGSQKDEERQVCKKFLRCYSEMDINPI